MDNNDMALPADRATAAEPVVSALRDGIPSAAVLSAWPESRPKRNESERAADAAYFARHLPEVWHSVLVENVDLDAMRAAFIRRFGEQLPRTETLMAVAHIGYRMAIRDAQAIEARSAETERLGRNDESAVGEADAPVTSSGDE
jgi:hypothetical protein